jgi:hypothetical protein
MTKSVHRAGQSSRRLYAGFATMRHMARRSESTTDRTLGLRVRIRRHVLDREIAAGLDPGDDPARATRAQQLLSAHERRCVAGCLTNILEAADERHADPTSPLKLNHAEVLATRHDLLALIAALRSDRVLAARGVALARLLTEADTSPLLRVRPGLSVQDAVAEAIEAL